MIYLSIPGMGNWKPDGCDTMKVNGSKNTTIQIQCRCFHLTNFALLVVSEALYHACTGHSTCIIFRTYQKE